MNGKIVEEIQKHYEKESDQEDVGADGQVDVLTILEPKNTGRNINVLKILE